MKLRVVFKEKKSFREKMYNGLPVEQIEYYAKYYEGSMDTIRINKLKNFKVGGKLVNGLTLGEILVEVVKMLGTKKYAVEPGKDLDTQFKNDIVLSFYEPSKPDQAVEVVLLREEYNEDENLRRVTFEGSNPEKVGDEVNRRALMDILKYMRKFSTYY